MRNPSASRLGDVGAVDAMLDTGSPWTFVPKWIAEDCRLEKIGIQCTDSIVERNIPFDYSVASIEIFGATVTDVKVLLNPHMDVAVIGRDVLWQFILTFDGPHRECRVGIP